MKRLLFILRWVSISPALDRLIFTQISQRQALANNLSLYTNQHIIVTFLYKIGILRLFTSIDISY